MSAIEEAEIDRDAARDRNGAPLLNGHAKPRPWKRGRELVKCIVDRMHDPWVDLTLAGDVIATVRVGSTVILIGGSGSGKTSLACCLLMEHVAKAGPAIAGSIELPDEEFGARIVGIKCDASWADALRGAVPVADMERVLDHPRLFALSRDDVTLKNLTDAIEAAQAEYPRQPILLVVDYTQILEIETSEREIRQRVSEVIKRLDRLARRYGIVVLALSQMSRASTDKARRGDALGIDAAALSAETAAIERYATFTITIGQSAARQDGSDAVEVSLGKGRMGQGDRVLPMTYWGRTGLWRVAGDAKTPDEVRQKRDADAETRVKTSVRLKIIGAAASSPAPVSKNQLVDLIAGDRVGRIKITKPHALKEIKTLLDEGVAKWRAGEHCDLVEVAERARGSQKGRPAWLVWTEDRAKATNRTLVREAQIPGFE